METIFLIIKISLTAFLFWAALDMAYRFYRWAIGNPLPPHWENEQPEEFGDVERTKR